VEQFLSDMTLSGEIVLSLASYEGERKLTQFEITRPVIFLLEKFMDGITAANIGN
jgi:hypothetical protein